MSRIVEIAVEWSAVRSILATLVAVGGALFVGAIAFNAGVLRGRSLEREEQRLVRQIEEQVKDVRPAYPYSYHKVPAGKTKPGAVRG